jgi:alpha-beta hydrolase superfamily lysophospholipase
MARSLPPLHRWESVPEPRAAVHIIHGMAEYGGRYARLAADLNRAGFVVWAHDHRGHGLNPTPPVGLGHFGDADGWRALIDDAWAVSEHVLASCRGLPLVLFAHSMGSFVAQSLMAERGTAYRAVVLSGTNGPPGAQEALVRGLAHAQRLALGGRRPGTWLDTAIMSIYNRRFAPNRTRCDWLSRDEREVDAYAADPLCGFTLTAQSWLDFLVSKPALGDPAHLKRIPRALPVHVIAGTRDPVGEESRGVQRLLRIYHEAGLSRVTHRFYEGARHELVNETNRDEVTRDLIAWLDGLGR